MSASAACRRALCTPAAVRAVYAALDADVRAALDELRGARRGLDAATLTARYGAVRPWRQLARDPQPRSVAERLLLLGWLLPRPAAPGRAAALRAGSRSALLAAAAVAARR
jgi:hypothetical protein